MSVRWNRGGENMAVTGGNQWRPHSYGRDEVVCLKEEDKAEDVHLSADGAGSQPDSVWGRLSNSRIHHIDCRPCHWWRHNSAVFIAENGGHLSSLTVLCFMSLFAHNAYNIECSLLYTYSRAYDHHAPCHPAIRYITHDLNTTNHCFLFCLTGEHN